jgi:hypothetical protein
MLLQTGAFSEVRLTGLPENYGFEASALAAVSIEPDSTADADLWDGGAATGSARTVRLNITFLARNEDAQLCDEACENLLMIAENALNGQPLVPGFNYPDKTKFLSWRWLPRTPPERRIAAVFTYTYEVDGWDSNDTSE